VDVLIDNLPRLLSGFWLTIQLLALSAIGALILGTILAAMRVSPIPVLRAAGTTYVTIFRNTPLVILFIIAVVGLPFIGIQISFQARAVVALTVYTASFVCEVLRSGINAVATGQAEAARAVGMTFGQTLGLIVLPQAIRSVLPPMASVLIALAKNTAVAEAFGVVEATYFIDYINTKHPSALVPAFIGISLGYVLIVFVISGITALLERRLAVVR
jgi:glutamate transport system permease protein